jgi:hypothetical protein
MVYYSHFNEKDSFMLIKLKWNNSNDATAAVQVFRGTATIDTANPGTPIATLPGNATSYDDSDVLAGVTYYYAVAVTKGAKRIFTPVKTFLNEAKRGPGGARILYGDERLGYMGKVSPVDFIDIVKYLGLGSAVANVYRMNWYKFIRKGKIIYVAEKPINLDYGTRVWGQTIRRNVGLVSGMQWGFNNSAWTDAAKTSIASFGGNTFHFRALRSLPDNWDGVAVTQALVNDPTTEFNELIPSLLDGEMYFANKIGCVRQGTVLVPNMVPIICAEKLGTKSLIRTMQPTAMLNNFWNAQSSSDRTKTSFLNFLMRDDATASTSEVYWQPNTWDAVWPVFEMV